jgi:eukaryotic-like serine/threonine-protein kinase
MICPRCGAKLAAAASSCPHCAASLDAAAEAGVLTSPSGEALTSLFGHGPASATTSQTSAGDADGATIFVVPPPPTRTRRTEAPTGFKAPPSAAIDTAVPDVATPETSVAAGPLEVGQAFGPRYHIIRILGIGGMGAVYQAWDAELGVAVAIKVIRPEVMADATAAAEIERRFKRELLLARQVTHKNVVRIHDLGDIDGIKYITMPYVDGADLATVLKRGKMPITRLLHIARSVVAGLVEAHKAGVVHRDLKPANIMISAEDKVMIMDFGIARSTGTPTGQAVPGANTIVRTLKSANVDASMFGAVVGTVAYMAPEQAKGVHVDQRADIYAFGLILYDLLVGESRSANVGPIAELQARMQHAPPPVKTLLPDVPEQVDAIISRCLEPDPDKRFQTGEELAAALAALDEDGNPIPIAPRFSKKLIAAAATAVLALVTTTWYVTRTPPPTKPHDPVTVLIADFNNNTHDPTFDHTLEPMLRLGLEGAGFINAYDRSRIRGTFSVQPPETLDEAAARQIALKQGVGVVLSGSIDRVGDGYEISIKTAQPISGNVTASTKLRAANKDQVLGAVTKLAATVRKVLGEKASQSDQLFAMRNISTGSLDVVSQYAAGIELQSKGKYEEAIQKFQKAVAIDPNFGLAYNSLSVNLKNIGRIQESEKFAKEALRHLDGMTERERFATRGNYYRITGDLQQCIKEYGELIARYSADTVAHNNRALCLGRLRDFRAAMAETRQALTILPNHMTYRANLALFANYDGDFATAEKEVRSIPQPSAGALQALPLSLVGQGRLQEAAESYQTMSTMGAFGASFAAAGLGDLALYEGRFADAVRIFEQAAAAAVTANAPDVAAQKLTALAYTQLSRGQNAAAIAAADRALSSSKALSVRFLSARILVEAGAVAKAQPIAASLASELATEPQAYGKIIEGEIALKKKDLPQAIKILTEANAVVDTWVGHFDLGRAYLEGHAFAQADTEFDRCIKRRGEALLLVDEDPTYGYFPPTYYYLGQAREGLQTAGYKDVYGEYLKIRGKSTDDPLLPDVRRRAGQ